MAVHVVTGKLGSGKTLVSVSRIQDYLARGRIVATNLNLKLHHMPRVGRFARKTHVIRIPDKPTLEDFQAIERRLITRRITDFLCSMNAEPGSTRVIGPTNRDSPLSTGVFMHENLAGTSSSLFRMSH